MSKWKLEGCGCAVFLESPQNGDFPLDFHFKPIPKNRYPTAAFCRVGILDMGKSSWGVLVSAKTLGLNTTQPLSQLPKQIGLASFCWLPLVVHYALVSARVIIDQPCQRRYRNMSARKAPCHTAQRKRGRPLPGETTCLTRCATLAAHLIANCPCGPDRPSGGSEPKLDRNVPGLALQSRSPQANCASSPA